MDALALLNPMAAPTFPAFAPTLLPGIPSLADARLTGLSHAAAGSPWDNQLMQSVQGANAASTRLLLLQVVTMLAALLKNQGGQQGSSQQGGDAASSGTSGVSGGGGGSSNAGGSSAGGSSNLGSNESATGQQVERQGEKIDASIADNFDAMVAAAKKDGVDLQIGSGWRSRAEQEVLYQKYLNGTGNLAAKPGTSNHESGQAIDFKSTPGAFDWLARNAEKFGLKNLPGEAWHYSVNGK